ncbi:hypothetical protein XbC2_542 [Xanthomonas phage XbC2]|nr:hypothetical protein XbC2_542 [Xanthomonas phage XbC2]
MNPSEAKAKQKKRYNEIAVLVANGRLGYIPANKSRFSKSASNKFAQDISFN